MDPGTPPLVLVIDDRPDVAEALAALCEEAGYRSCVADRGAPIGELIGAHRPAAVLLDILMPDQDGYEALREIGRIDPRLPVLLISGAGDSWLRMGESLARAHGLRTVQTAAKPVGAPAIRQFLAGIVPIARG